MKRKKDKKTTAIDGSSAAGAASHPFYSKRTFILPVIIIIAALLRIVCLWQCSSGYDFFFTPQPGTDMCTYHEQALGILKGTFPQQPFYYNPLYPYFLAVIYWLTSNNIVMVYVFQALLGLLTCLLVYLISRDMFNRTTALLAAGLTCLSFDLILYTGILLSATLDTFLCLLGIFLLLSLKKSPKILTAILCGIVWGLAVLSRPNTAIFAIAGIGWLAFAIVPSPIRKGSRDRRLAAILCLVLTISMALTISPVTIKNYQTSGGKIIPVSTNGPDNFWIGNNASATGWFHRPYRIQEVQKIVEQEGQKAWIRDAVRFMSDDPAGYGSLLLKKFSLFWSNQSVDSNNLFYSRFKTYSSILSQGYVLSIGIIFPLGLAGIFLCLWLKRSNCLPLHLFVLIYSLSVVIIFILDRFRLPVIPVMCIFGAFFVLWCYEQVFRLKGYKTVLITLLVLAIFAACVNLRLLSRQIYPHIFSRGIYAETKRHLIIRDDTNLWDGLKTETLTPPISLQKSLFLDREPDKIKAAYVCFEFASMGKGQIILEINGQPLGQGNCGDTGGFLTASRINIPVLLLKKGINTITLNVSSGLLLTIPIDSFYCFSRSQISQVPEVLPHQEKNWQVIDGEYRIWLEMEK